MEASALSGTNDLSSPIRTEFVKREIAMVYKSIRLFLYAGLLSCCVFARAQKPRMTKDQALQRAMDFCKAIGEPMTPSPEIEFSPPPNRRLLPECALQPVWRIFFPARAEVEISDRSGVVCAYRNLALFDEISKDNRPAGQAIPQADAIKIVLTALDATGQTDELGEPEAHEGNIALPPTAGAHSWTISCRRKFQGVPYHRDQIGVELHAESGRIKLLLLAYMQQAPNIVSLRTSLVVTKEQAITAARAHLSGRGIPATGELLRSGLALVQPNTFWTDGRAGNFVLGPSIPAWTLFLKTGENSAHYVWVDAKTGLIIGGERWGALLSAAPPKSKTPSKLRK